MILMHEEEMLTAEEVARMLRLTEDSVTRLLRQGKLPGVKIAGSWRITRKELQEYLEELRAKQQKRN